MTTMLMFWLSIVWVLFVQRALTVEFFSVDEEERSQRILKDNELPKLKLVYSSRTNISDLMRRDRAARNVSRFTLAPLPRPPLPTNLSCLLSNSSADASPINHKVLLFVDFPFFTLFLNWLAHFTDVCGQQRHSSLEVVCMDERVVSHIAARNLSCSAHSFLLSNESFHNKHLLVWGRRMDIVIHYLQRNTSILLSDLDALWRKDPYVELKQLHTQGYQLIASRGSWPQQFSAQWGATICMGFMYLRPSPFTIHLMNSTRNLMLNTTPDDQQAINTILGTWRVRWSVMPMPLLDSVKVDFGRVPWPPASTATEGAASSSNAVGLFNATGGQEEDYLSVKGVSIALLSHSQFMRNCSRSRSRSRAPMLSNKIRKTIRDLTVAHCHVAPGNAYKKFLSLQTIGLWHTGVPLPLMNETKPVIPNDRIRNSHNNINLRSWVNNTNAIRNLWRNGTAILNYGDREVHLRRGANGKIETVFNRPPPQTFRRPPPPSSLASPQVPSPVGVMQNPHVPSHLRGSDGVPPLPESPATQSATDPDSPSADADPVAAGKGTDGEHPGNQVQNSNRHKNHANNNAREDRHLQQFREQLTRRRNASKRMPRKASPTITTTTKEGKKDRIVDPTMGLLVD